MQTPLTVFPLLQAVIASVKELAPEVRSPPPRTIWGPEEERLAQGLAQARTGQGGQGREATALPSLTGRLLEMLRQDEIRREEDRQRRLQDEARRDRREKEQ